MSKFSIVITTYNRLSLLKRSLASALAQTLPSEVIIADDASSDGTQDYIKSLQEGMIQTGDRRLIYHRNTANLGHSATVNAGVNIATGDWVKLLDDDDYLAANCIEEMQRAIALHPKTIICSAQAAQVDINNKEVSRTQQVGTGKVFHIPQEDIHYGMLLEQVPFGTPVQVAFHRDTFLKTGGWDSQFDANFDDIDSWVKIAQFGDAVFLNQCLAYRTLWAGALNQKLSIEKRLETNILIKKNIYNFVNKKHYLETPIFEDIEAYLKLHWGLIALKQKKISTARNILFPSIFSPKAWALFRQSIKKPSKK